MVNLEEIMLREEDGMDGEVTDVESTRRRRVKEILGASSRGPKRA